MGRLIAVDDPGPWSRDFVLGICSAPVLLKQLELQAQAVTLEVEPLVSPIARLSML